MKNFQFLLILLFIFTFQSCKDACKKVECGHGVCKDGDCICESGWQKDASGACVKQDLCFGKDCVNGTCNDSIGACNCNPGWFKDSQGKCTVQDLCYQKDCGIHGDCNAVNGDCICGAGYEKDAAGKCNAEGRAKFIGSWRGNDNGATNPTMYTLTISSFSADVSKVVLTGFANSMCSGTDLIAVGSIIKGVDGKYSTIGNFTSDCTGLIINSSTQAVVTSSGLTLTISYSFVGGGTTFNYTDVLTKQ